MADMKTLKTITSEHVRQHLLARASEFIERNGGSFSSVSEAAVQDSKFLGNVARGSNFTLRTYQRVIDWLDEKEGRKESVA